MPLSNVVTIYLATVTALVRFDGRDLYLVCHRLGQLGGRGLDWVKPQFASKKSPSCASSDFSK